MPASAQYELGHPMRIALFAEKSTINKEPLDKVRSHLLKERLIEGLASSYLPFKGFTTVVKRDLFPRE